MPGSHPFRDTNLALAKYRLLWAASNPSRDMSIALEKYRLLWAAYMERQTASQMIRSSHPSTIAADVSPSPRLGKRKLGPQRDDNDAKRVRLNEAPCALEDGEDDEALCEDDGVTTQDTSGV